MFPNDFDVVLAGAPAWWTTHLQTWTLQVGLMNAANTTGPIPKPLFSVIINEVCDDIDNLLDGITTDPKTCDFYPELILCTSVNQTNCLSSAQLQTLYKLYSGYVDTNQTSVFPSFKIGSEGQRSVLIGFKILNVHGTGYVQDTLDYHNFDYSIVQLANANDPSNATANNFDLRTFTPGAVNCLAMTVTPTV